MGYQKPIKLITLKLLLTCGLLFVLFLYRYSTGWRLYFDYQFDKLMTNSGIKGVIKNLLAKAGISPFYFITILFMVISLLTLDDLKSWDKLSILNKSRDIELWIFSIMCLIVSVVMVLNNLFN